MPRHQLNAASEQEATSLLESLPAFVAGDEVALCCSACGTVLERAIAPSLVRAELFAKHACGAPRQPDHDAEVDARQWAEGMDRATWPRVPHG